MVLTRVSAERPPKSASNSTSDEPFQLIEIQGNICKFFGCGLPLRDGPPRYGVNELDSKHCLRHKEQDHFYLEKYRKWIPKMKTSIFMLQKNVF